jgi:hypothetical protein
MNSDIFLLVDSLQSFINVISNIIGIGIMISDKKRNQSLWHCVFHDYDLMKPILHETLRPGAQGGCTDNSAVIAETQVSKKLNN